MPNFAFHALDRNPANGVMEGVRRGIGALTEARTSEIYQPDWEDVWRVFRSGEPAYKGGRRVENLLLQSNALNITWANVTSVDTQNQGTDPTGGSAANKLTDGGGGGTGNSRISQAITGLVPGATYTASVSLKADQVDWLRLNIAGNGSEVIRAHYDLINGVLGATVGADNVAQSIEDAGSGWYRGSVTWTQVAGDTTASIELFLADGDNDITVSQNSNSSVLIYGTQLENVSGQADQSPSEYQPTTTAPVATVYATEKDGTPLADLPWLYGGPAGTNEITYSRDLTNAVWVETGTNVAALDAVGLEGAANTASTLTDNDGAALEYVTEDVTIPNDSNNHVVRVLIAKDSDVARFPELRFLCQGGTSQSLYLQVNTLTGARATVFSAGTVDSEVNDVGDWWEVLLSVTNNSTANITGRAIIMPAGGTIIGTTNVAATGSIVVGNVEFHLNKTIAQVRGSTPIFTSGSTVTVDATDLSFDDGNHVDLEGAYFCEFKNVGLNAANQGGLVGLGTSGRISRTSTSASFRSFDGTTDAIGPVVTLAADDTEYKFGLAYGSSLKRVNTDDSWGVEDDYDGGFDNANLKLNVLSAQNFGSVPISTMLMRNLRRYDMTYAAAQSAIDGMMNGIYPILANTLTDLRYLALRVLVPTAPPTTNDMLFAWLATEGGTGNTLSDRWRSMLIGKGATPGHFNDMWMQVLALNGFNQPQLNDRQIAFWANGGGLI